MRETVRSKLSARLIASVLLTALVGTFAAVQAGLRVNLSASMPRGLYRLVRCGETVGREAGLGDRVAIDTRAASANPRLAFFRRRGWLSTSGRSDDLLTKTIVAVGGDEVTDVAGRLHVNGRALSRGASRRERVVGGLVLPQEQLPRRIHEDEVWLSSEHEKGIDSRYFGPVARSSIACGVKALWTR